MMRHGCDEIGDRGPRGGFSQTSIFFRNFESKQGHRHPSPSPSRHPPISATMPPRLPAMRIASRVLRPRQPLVHRPYSTAPPPLPSPLQTRSLRIPLIAGALGFTTGLLFYTLSHSSTAEVQSSKTSSAHENRELTASASRKAGEEEGKTAANKAGGSPQDHKAARGVGYEKPEDGASGESRTGKVNGGHDESGQPKDERIRKAKSGEKSEKMKEEKKDGAEKKKEGESEGQDEGDEEQRGAVGIAAAFSGVLTWCRS